MNITIQGKVRKYIVKSDDDNFTITPINIIEKGDNKGKESTGKSRHFPRLEQLADALYQLELTDSDAETVQDMLKCIFATRRLIKTACWTQE